MSLDQNLFTLHLTQHKEYPNVIDLVDPSGTAYYRKQRLGRSDYKIEVYDPLSESLLVTATAPSATSKVKILELCNPTQIVELKYTGTLTFRWGFKWEEHEFEWKREECYMLRKPDPPVLVAITKEPTGKLKTTSVQILDYNLNRFDIDDRKGLEIIILTALLTFSDSNEAYHTSPAPSTGNSRATSIPEIAKSSVVPNAPPKPPKPAPKMGIDRIAELQAIRGEYNEVIVEDEGDVQVYAQYCSNLLSDDAMLFITVKSAEAKHVPKVLQVVEEAKRIRYKAGLTDEEELHQYVMHNTETKRKATRRINLDGDEDKNKDKYAPPSNLVVYLSKISMPELQPKAHTSDKTGRTRNKLIAAPPSSSPPNSELTNAKTKTKTNKISRPAQPSGKPGNNTKPHPSQKLSRFPNPSTSSSPIPHQSMALGGALNSGSHPSSSSTQLNHPRPTTVVSTLFDKLHFRTPSRT